MKALSLFSGIGGIDLAAEWAGIETVGFCEREPFCQKVLAKHWPNIPIYDDVCTLTKERLEADGIGTIELIHGGYPCQPFSLAGDRKGSEDDRHLWPEVRRLIETIRPRWFVGENVAGHVTLGLDDVLSDLGSIGYTWQPFIIPASAVYAQHRRERVFIVAYSNSSGMEGRQKTGNLKTGREESYQQSMRYGEPSENVANAESKRSGEARELRHNESEEWITSSGENVSNSASSGLSIRGQSGITESNSQTGARMESEFERCSKNVAYSNGKSESQTGSGFSAIGSEWDTWDDVVRSRGGIQSGTDWWAVEPPVGRVANGIPQRVDRLKALGNAVVPQQIYPILAAIKQIDEMMRAG